MTEHAVAYEIRYARDASNGTHHPQITFSQQLATLAVTNAVGTTTSDAVPDPLLPYCALPNSAAPGQPVSSFNGVLIRNTTPLAVSSFLGRDSWNIQGAYTANTAADLALQASDLPIYGRQAPPLRIKFSGAAEAAIKAAGAVPASISGTITYGYPVTAAIDGLLHFIDFETRPPNTDTDGSQEIGAIMQLWSNSGDGRYLLGVTAGGTELYANACGYAGVLPQGTVFCRPEDIGVGPDQIGPFNTQNTVSGFRSHPGVFIRRLPYIRSLQRIRTDTVAIDAAGATQPFRIVQITTAPTFSTWLLCIDGVYQIVRIIHPANSDLRRPRDIWNQLIAPKVSGGQSLVNALSFAGVDGTQTVSAGLTTRLAYLDYARCLSINGTNDPYLQVPV